MRRALIAPIAFLTFGAAFAQTPNLNILRMNGGITPAYQCNYTLGSLCGGESYSTASLHTVADKTGAVTYASNNLLTQSNTFNNAAWTTGNSSVSQNAPGPNGVANTATTLTATAALPSIVYQAQLISSNAIASFNVAPGTKNWVYLQINFASGLIAAVSFNVSSGAVGTSNWVVSGSGAGLLSGAAISPAGNGFFTVSVKASGSAVSYVSAGVANGDAATTVSIGSSVIINAATASAVTYEATPRLGQNGPNDAVVTTSAAYYGAPFTNTLGTGSPSKGLQYEPAGTNLYINSGVPATQTVTVANGTTYTSSIRQTGTQTFSGAITAVLTGIANTVVSNTSAASTTSLVATDASLAATSYPQVEAGTYPTSVIISGATATTRAADSLTTTGKLATANAAGPSIIEYAPESTGTPTRAIIAKSGALFTTGRLYRRVCVYPPGTPNAYLNAHLTVGGSC